MEDAVTAEISFMSLKWADLKSAHTFTACRDGNVFDSLSHLLLEEKRNLNDAELRKVTIRFQFLPMKGRRAGVLCAEITPTNLSVKCKDTERRDIIFKYLKKWEVL
jgi:hypothetical protein